MSCIGRNHRNVTRDGNDVEGEYEINPGQWIRFEASWNLLRVQAALDNETAFDRIWDLQDGYGVPGFTPSQGFDWSGIRDSTPEARAQMDAVASEFVSDADLEEALGLAEGARS